MWPGYIFSRFPEHFFAYAGFKSFSAFAHFRNARKHAIRLYIFLVFMSVFGFLSMFEMHKGLWSGHIFSRFMRDLKKVIKVNFRSVVQLK